MKKKKSTKSKLIIALVVIIAAAAGIYAAAGGGTEVSAAFVEYGSVEKFITETGSVEAKDSAVVSSRIQGQLLSVSVSEGDMVTAGQSIAAYTADSAAAADIGSIRAQISGLQVQADQANGLAGRNRALYEEGAISYEEYSQSEAAARQIESQISALNYSIAGLSEAAGARGVFAPISGTVTAVMVREGEMVGPGAPLIEISDISETYIRVNLIAEDADKIAAGSRARVLSESETLIDDEATVSRISVRAQDVLSDLGIVQKRVPVEITLSDEKNLRLGSNVTVEIIVDSIESALRVPETAIFEINREHYVYKIENRRATLNAIQIGLEGEKYTEIKSGLTEGDIIITSPARQIEDGIAVKVLNTTQ